MRCYDWLNGSVTYWLMFDIPRNCYWSIILMVIQKLVFALARRFPSKLDIRDPRISSFGKIGYWYSRQRAFRDELIAMFESGMIRHETMGNIQAKYDEYGNNAMDVYNNSIWVEVDAVLTFLGIICLAITFFIFACYMYMVTIDRLISMKSKYR